MTIAPNISECGWTPPARNTATQLVYRMNDTIINGLFTLSGVLIGSASSFFATRDARRMAKLESLVSKLAEQVASYWELEKHYSEEVATLSGKNSKTVLNEFRERVESEERERPTMTAKQADGIKRHFL